MDVVTITGWGQKVDALDNFASSFGKVRNIDYINLPGAEKFFAELKKYNKKCDILIGWSLGAQLAARAITANIVNPKLLVLIAPPYQYVRGGKIKSGVHPFAFSFFKHAYEAFPGNTMREFGALVCQNDDHAMDIIATMDDDNTHHKGWIHWLGELEKFSCTSLDFSGFPRTLIFHGDGDEVTDAEQGKIFHKKIKNSRIEILKHCGHAPHLHDPEFVIKVIKDELKKL